MTLVVSDRVQETCAAPGTGVVTLLGASNGYQSFSSGIGANNTTYYTIVDQSGTNWEVGLGTVGATGLTLTRTTVLSSSNSGSLVNFSAGIQNVWGDYPAGKAVYKDSIGTVTVPQLATNSTTSTTPVLSFNASNSNYAAGATISGSYLQTLLQNKSGTAGASTNYVLSNDLGTDSSYYGEFGMNSSVFSASTPTDFFSINNGVYFSGHDGDITFGSGNGYKSYFAWGTSGQSAHVINASGALGFSTNLGTTPALSGTTGYGTAGQVPVSGGSGSPVAWSSTPTLTGTNFSGIPYSALTGTVPTWNQNTTGQAGSVVNSHTASTGLSGSSFNGSAAVSWTLATAYGDSINPYASKTANYFLAAPNGSAGVPTFRAIVAADIPTLNQNTTGNAATTSQTNFSNLTIGSSQVLYAGNYNSYSPTLTGSGASGTWGINITGNAESATTANNGAKIWVNFNGVGTVSIRASYNVSSVTRNGTGDYTLNFSITLADTNYAPTTSIGRYTTGNYGLGTSNVTFNTTSLRINTFASGGNFDLENINIAIFR